MHMMRTARFVGSRIGTRPYSNGPTTLYGRLSRRGNAPAVLQKQGHAESDSGPSQTHNGECTREDTGVSAVPSTRNIDVGAMKYAQYFAGERPLSLDSLRIQDDVAFDFDFEPSSQEIAISHLSKGPEQGQPATSRPWAPAKEAFEGVQIPSHVLEAMKAKEQKSDPEDDHAGTSDTSGATAPGPSECPFAIKEGVYVVKKDPVSGEFTMEMTSVLRKRRLKMKKHKWKKRRKLNRVKRQHS